MPPLDTMEIVGHARIAVTMEVYTSADGTTRRDANGKLNQLLETAPGLETAQDGHCCHCCCHLAPGARCRDGCEAVTWVGLGGLEPPTSSLSGMAAMQAGDAALGLTSAFISQHPPGHPSGMHPLDA
jgi:hypothetical protein